MYRGWNATENALDNIWLFKYWYNNEFYVHTTEEENRQNCGCFKGGLKSVQENWYVNWYVIKYQNPEKPVK